MAVRQLVESGRIWLVEHAPRRRGGGMRRQLVAAGVWRWRALASFGVAFAGKLLKLGLCNAQRVCSVFRGRCPRRHGRRDAGLKSVMCMILSS